MDLGDVTIVAVRKAEMTLFAFPRIPMGHKKPRMDFLRLYQQLTVQYIFTAYPEL